MNIFAQRQSKPSFDMPVPMRTKSPVPEAEFDLGRDGRKMEHTGFRARTFNDTFLETAQSLPRQQQLNLASTMLVSQLFQNGIKPENRDFIKSYRQRFNDNELRWMRDQVRSNPAFRTRKENEVENILKQLEQIWSDNPAQQAEEPGATPVRWNPLVSPDQLFFKTSSAKPWVDKKVLKLLM